MNLKFINAKQAGEVNKVHLVGIFIQSYHKDVRNHEPEIYGKYLLEGES